MKTKNTTSKHMKKTVFSLSGKSKLISSDIGASTQTTTTNPTTGSFTC